MCVFYTKQITKCYHWKLRRPWFIYTHMTQTGANHIRTLASISVNENFATSVKNRQVQQYNFSMLLFFTHCCHDKRSTFLRESKILYILIKLHKILCTLKEGKFMILYLIIQQILLIIWMPITVLMLVIEQWSYILKNSPLLIFILFLLCTQWENLVPISVYMTLWLTFVRKKKICWSLHHLLVISILFHFWQLKPWQHYIFKWYRIVIPFFVFKNGMTLLILRKHCLGKLLLFHIVTNYNSPKLYAS